jgi:hypothetical protein
MIGLRVYLITVAVSIVLSACARPTYAPTSVTPQQILDANRRVMGTFQGTGSVHLRYRTLASDGEVSFVDRYEAIASKNYRATTTLGSVRASVGQTSGHRWLQDVNGLVVADATLPSVFDRARSAATRTRDTRLRVLGITEELPRRYVLEIAPNERIFERTYYDAVTSLLTEAVTRDYDGAIRDERYSGVVRVAGKLFTLHRVHSDNLSTRTYETTLVTHERLPDGAEAFAIPQSKPPFALQRALPATLNTLFDSTGILVRVDIGGTPYWLKLDSGATSLSLDRDVVRRLGLREFAQLSSDRGGHLEESSAIVPRMDIGPLFAKNVVVRVFHHDNLEQGVHVVGLAGCDLIGSHPLAVDFRQETVTVLSRAPGVGDPAWNAVRTPLFACVPSIAARFESRPATLILDLGASGTFVNDDVFASIAKPLMRLGVTRFRFVGGESLSAVQYVVPHASVGNLAIGPLVASVIDGGRGQDLFSDGLLGRDVLERYRLVLDYAHERTYFQPDGDADDSGAR